MSKFPLYDNLSKKLSKRDLFTKQKKEFINLVQELDNEGYELMYTLIKIHSVQNPTYSINNYNIPYNGKCVQKDIIFDLDLLPIPLKRILFKFVKIHIKKMKEDLKRKKIQS
jgi:hypothetical protein